MISRTRVVLVHWWEIFPTIPEHTQCSSQVPPYLLHQHAAVHVHVHHVHVPYLVHVLVAQHAAVNAAQACGEMGKAHRSLKVIAFVLVFSIVLTVLQWWRENKSIAYGDAAIVARTIIIGDCHGCASALRALLRKVDAQHGRDRVILVGDLVGKGPEPHEVIRLAREIGALAVRGNHEERLLRWWRAGKPKTGPASLKRKYAATVASLDESDWRWLNTLPTWLSFPELRVHPAKLTGAGDVGANSVGGKAAGAGGQGGSGVIVVHAGLPNPGAIERVGTMDQEFGPGTGHLAAAMALQDRNMLLNMRSVDKAGRPNAGKNGMPWAQQWRGPATIVFGHDARRGLQVEEYALGLDSGCVYGGRLTALVVDAEPDGSSKSDVEHRSKLVSVNCHKDWTGRAKKWKTKKKSMM